MLHENIKLKKFINWSFLLTALAGILDATYLTIEHYIGNIGCVVTTGCHEVTTSKYSFIMGIPVALLGLIYYCSMFLAALIYLKTQNEKILAAKAFATIFGLGASVWFTLAQALILHSYCFYCLISAGISTLLFIQGAIVLLIFRSQRKARKS